MSRLWIVLVIALFVSLGGASNEASAAPSINPDAASVTIYGAKWCPACHSLEASLRQRSIPFRVIDIDKHPAAYSAAAKASGKYRGVPLTRVQNGATVTWFEGSVSAREIDHARTGH